MAYFIPAVFLIVFEFVTVIFYTQFRSLTRRYLISELEKEQMESSRSYYGLLERKLCYVTTILYVLIAFVSFLLSF